MHLFSKKIARAIDKSVDCKRVGVAVIGLEVAHAHIHLIPLNEIGDLNFANPKMKFSRNEFLEIAEGAKLGCPVSAALTGVEIKLQARLIQ